MPDWYPWPDDPGQAVFCQEQAQVAAARHDVAVLTWRGETRLRKRVEVSEEREDGLLTLRVRYRQTGVPKLIFFYKLYGCLVALSRLRRRHRWVPEVIHAHEYPAGILALCLGRLTRAPVVVSEHNSAFPRGILERRDLLRAKIVFRRSAVVTPVSADLARFLAPLTRRTPVITVPNTVDPRVFSPARRGLERRPAGRLVLVTVGQVIEVKGHRHLIDALDMLSQDGVDAEVHIVGEGDLRERLEQHASDLGLADRVTFHGYLAKPQIAELMRHADIFVLPSLWENMPCVVLEAIASGLPVVASRVGGVPEVVDSDVGLTVDPESPRALAEGVMNVAGNLDRYHPDVLHETAERRYGPDAVARQWAQVYELAQGPRRAVATENGRVMG